MGILRYIFLFVIGYFVWRTLDNLFSKNKGQPGRRPQNQNVKFKEKPQDKSHIPDDEGDYIDYEEMK